MLSLMSDIMIDRGIRALGHVRDIVSFWNDTDKRFISMRMRIVQLPGVAVCDTHT